MEVVPDVLRGVFFAWAAGFGETVFPQFVTLLLGAVLTTGRRTVSRVVFVVGELADADPSSDHRVLSMRRWSMWSLARPLVAAILDTFLPHGVVCLVGDETVTEHPGRKVFGQGRHRDAKRSSPSFVAHLGGHQWVVLAILVKRPGIQRPWALPVLVALYRNEKDHQAAGRRHKTPRDLMRQLRCVLLRWFPTRQFVFAGDGGDANHRLTRFARRQEQRLTLVSRFDADAALSAAPPRLKKRAKGRPRVKGKKRPSPQDVGQRTKPRKKRTVNWYGGPSRRVEVVTGTGHWYQSGEGLVEVLWLFVQDLTGTHRDEDFFTTDVTQAAKPVIETFTGRWSISGCWMNTVTFQEVRADLGVETTRGGIERTVLRAEPCLFCLDSVVALWYAALPERDRQNREPTWTGKTTVTFSDAITLVRRDLWSRWIFATPAFQRVRQKLTPHQKRQLTRTLTLAT